MAKVTIHNDATPSEAIVRAANKAGEVTDALGRVIRFRKLGAGHKQRWAAVMGPDLIRNEICSTQGFFAYAVTHIDGDEVLTASSYRELLLTIDRLDDEGIEAVGEAYVQAFGAPGDQVDPGAVKNS